MVLSFDDLPSPPGSTGPPALPATYHGLHIAAAGNGSLALANAQSISSEQAPFLTQLW